MSTAEALESLLVLPGSAGSLNFLIDSYISRHARKRLRTWKSIHAKLLRNVGFLGMKKLEDITSNDAEQLHQNIGEQTPYEANRVIQHLKSAWNKGVSWGICPAAVNPFAAVTLYPEESRERFLSPDEVRRLVAAAESDHPNIRDFVILSLCTLARMSNVLSMRWQDINFQENTWTIPKDNGKEQCTHCRSKNGTSQTIPLGNHELKLLLARVKESGGSPWVFPSEQSKCGHMNNPYKAFKRVVARAGLKNCRIHDLRRTGASTMANLNVNIALVKSALNHKSIKTTLGVYTHTVNPAELAARQLAQKQWFGAMDTMGIWPNNPPLKNVQDVAAI